MKTIIIQFLVIAVLFGSCVKKDDSKKSEKLPIRALSLGEVKITDSFWGPILDRNRKITIPYAFDMCEITGRIENFAIASGNSKKKYTGERYNDSDVFKIIEGAAKSLITSPDPTLESYLDSLVLLIAEAQEPDGYLYTARSADPENPAPGSGHDRWTDVWISHELYNAGHLYEAAVAYKDATGKDELLNVALKNADLVCKVFGPEGQIVAPGHQEIEIGLLKLYQITGNKKYLNQAKFFLDVRGTAQEHELHEEGTRFAIYNNLEYLQQHLPISDQHQAVGHAVRATYMYTAMTRYAGLSHSSEYMKKSEELWNDVITTKLYLTGGIGAVGNGESFGGAYYLPNDIAYNETCAAIGNVFWNWNLFTETGDSKYIDILERTLYNGLISGVGLDGRSFFYPNPLESKGEYTRSPWFGVACCPGNLCRFFPQIPKMIYSLTEEDIYVNLFISSSVKTSLHGHSIEIIQQTNYPWEGRVKLVINPEKTSEFTVRVRIPAWLGRAPFEGNLYAYSDSLQYDASITVNSKPARYSIGEGYALISKRWKKGDKIEIDLPLPTRKVIANKKVEADQGKIALERGPLVYCLEEADNGKLSDLELSPNFTSSYEYNMEFLGGTGMLKIEDNASTYMAIPYFLWSNRGVGEMKVWINEKNER